MTQPHVQIIRFQNGQIHQRWTFAHIAGNGHRQVSRNGYVSKWGARRAAAKLYPGVPVVDPKS